MAKIFRELIKQKRDGADLSVADIKWMISQYVEGVIPDYQMSAMLMAIFNQGMKKDEMVALTQSMRDSGDVIDLSSLKGPKVDKHSTGGVGDKTSMILGPIVAACGAYVPMMAGRGLGHTGGTLDKLEAIPSYNTQLTVVDFKKHLQQNHLSIIGQTDNICPADKKLYALRDVTATIESIPLICASIMSKKLAEGIDALVLDVKYGNGAFMKTVEEAKVLAKNLKDIGEANGKKVRAVISNMNQVLGAYVGNNLEIYECLEILKNKRDPLFEDCRELSLVLAAHMLEMSGIADTYDAAYAKAEGVIHSGEAYDIFCKMVAAQGGKLEAMPEPYPSNDICAEATGYIQEMDTEAIGVAGILLKAGRAKADDKIDYLSGFKILKKIGDKVEKGEVLAEVYANKDKAYQEAYDMVQNAFRIGKDRINPEALIEESLV